MKSNAHLYLPWSVIEEWLATSMGYQLKEMRLGRSHSQVASVEQLEGGCVVYRLTPRSGRNAFQARRQ
jgi:hypothetical protein